MNCVYFLSLIFLLGSVTAIAQNSGTAQSPGDSSSNRSGSFPLVQLILGTSPNSCPTGILIREEGIARLLYIKGAPPPQGQAIGLRITLSNSRSVGITSAQITVHGSTTGAVTRVAPALPSTSAASRTFRLPIKVDPGQHASTELWVKGFVSVSSIDLDALAYADGSNWKSSQHRQCQVSPNLRIGGIER